MIQTIKILLITCIILLSIKIHGQDVLSKYKIKHPSLPIIETTSNLKEDTLYYNKADYVDIKKEINQISNVSYTVIINNSYLKIINKKDTNNLKIIGLIRKSKIKGISTNTIRTKYNELIFIPVHKKFIIISNKKYITKLFNHE